MSILIFGANGQDGRYLTHRCSEAGFEVIGISRSTAPVVGDVANRQFVESLIQQHQPTHVFHLAAKSSTRHDAAFENHATIGTGTLNILEAVYRFSPETRVFLAGSALQFVNRGEPISETDPFDATSPYTATRNYSAYLSRYYRKLGVKAYFGYLFHHESLHRKPGHLSKMIADAAVRAKAGERFTLEIGDLSVEKEWTFAGDTVEAIWALVNQDAVFEANVGSGVAHSVADWAEACFSAVGKSWRDFVVQSKVAFRPEYQRLVSNPGRIHSLGWQPKVSLSQLSEQMVHHSE